MRKIVNISLPESLNKRVDKEVKKGHYASRSEFFRDLLRERIGEEKPSLTLDEIKEKALPILKKAKVKRASVFGSAARGELGPDSDIDFLVEFPEDASMFDLVDLEHDLKEELEYNIDIVTFNSVHPYLKENILKSQEPIF